MGDTGGHNPWEAAHLGCAVLHGPNVANFVGDYAALHAADAATKVENVAGLLAALLNPELKNQAARAKILAETGTVRVDQLCSTLLALLP